jgi:hypothetical protein
MSEKIKKFKINWDIDAQNKRDFFHPIISGCISNVICLPFRNNDNYCFYEIAANEYTRICIEDATYNLPINENYSIKPFIYIKNIGCEVISLYASNNNTGEYFDSGVYSFSENRLNDKISCSGSDFLIAPNENLILTLNTSQDGSQYYSKGTFPFGFFYELKNAEIINPNGSPPIYSIDGISSYIYEPIENLDLSYYCSGNLTNFSGYLECLNRIKCNPIESSGWSASFSEGLNFEIFSTGSGDNNINFESGFNNFCLKLNYFPEEFPSENKNYSLFKLKSSNSDVCYICCGGSGVLNNFDYELFRIDSDGYLYFGLTKSFDQCKSYLNGICINSPVTVLRPYNGISGGTCSYSENFGVSFSFKPTCISDEYTKNILLKTDRWNIYTRCSGIFYQDKFNNILTGGCFYSGLNCVSFIKTGSCLYLDVFNNSGQIDLNLVTGQQCSINIAEDQILNYKNLPIVKNLEIANTIFSDNYYYRCGTGAYISLNNSLGGLRAALINDSAFVLDSCEYSVEIFVKPTNTGNPDFNRGNLLILNGLSLLGSPESNKVIINNSGVAFDWHNYIPNNCEFHHILVSRKDCCFKFFINGCYISGFTNTNTGIGADNSLAHFGIRPGYGNYDGNFSSLRIIKNQSLYHDCCSFDRVYMPLTSNGYGSNNDIDQNITGCVAFLGFTGTSMQAGICYYFGSGPTYVSFDTGAFLSVKDCAFEKPNQYLGAFYKLYACQNGELAETFVNYNSFCNLASGYLDFQTTTNFPEASSDEEQSLNSIYYLKSNSGVLKNCWNLLDLKIQDQSSGLHFCTDLNCVNVLDCFVSYEDTGFLHENLSYITGMCDAINCCQLYNSRSIQLNPDQETYAINYISDIYFKRSSEDLCLNFDFKNKNFFKTRSFGVDLNLDCGITYEVSFKKDSNFINTGNEGFQYFGDNFKKYNVSINKLQVFCNSNEIDNVSTECIPDFLITGTIDSDACYCLIYNINSNSIQYKNYLYFSSGEINPICHIICNANGDLVCENIPTSSGSYCKYITGSASGLTSIISENGFNLNLKYIADCGTIVKDLVNANYDRCNLYIPYEIATDAELNFQLTDINFNKKTGISGGWVDLENLNISENFVNSSSFVSDQDPDYLCYQPEIYNLTGCINENRFSTNSIEQKNEQAKSEAFQLFYRNTTESLCYCCLEFKYYPVCSIDYDGKIYYADTGFSGVFFSNGLRSGCIDFPIDAFGQCNFKILNEYQVFEKTLSSDLNSEYCNFNFKKNQDPSNYFEYKYIKINCSNFSGKESPNLNLNIFKQNILQKNLSFYISPFDQFQEDKFYSLRDLIYFIISDLNSGLASDYINYSGLQYGTTDYNLFMVELHQEYENSNFCLPTGNCSILLNNVIKFYDYSSSFPLPYKSASGNAYNFVMPISNEVNYIDCVDIVDSGVLNNNYVNSGVFNFCSLQFYFTGGASGLVPIYSGSCVTGYESGLLTNSSAIISPNQIILNYKSDDINNWSGDKSINIFKNYTFSGVQPIYIESNYSLYKIKNPMTDKNLREYCAEINGLSGYYYYNYNIQNTGNLKFRFTSPEGTLISYVCWTDQEGEKSISYGDSNCYGTILENAGLINFMLNRSISCNNYSYSDGELKICINLAGGI